MQYDDLPIAEEEGHVARGVVALGYGVKSNQLYF